MTKDTPSPRIPGRRRAILGRFTRTIVIPLICFLAGAEMVLLIGRRRGPEAAQPPGGGSAGAPRASCSLSASFSANLYPSLILSLGAAYPEYTRCLRVSVRGTEPGSTVRLRVSSPLFLEPLVCVCESTGRDLSLNPTLPWNYDALRRSNQIHPEAFTATLEVNGLPEDQQTLQCQVHSVNEAVTRLYDEDSNQWVDTTVCFAAFVNEDHPWINQLLQESLARGGIKAFTGYQSGAQAIPQQMQAVWDALAARDLNYVNLSADSSVAPEVTTQYVRFLDQAVRDEGANCVDASALFAAIFRRIGLRSVLLFKPGHCFVGVYDAPEGGRILAIETTLLGSAGFAAAQAAGSQELLDTLPFVGNPHYSVLEIGLARKQGVNPIPYEEPEAGAAGDGSASPAGDASSPGDAPAADGSAPAGTAPR